MTCARSHRLRSNIGLSIPFATAYRRHCLQLDATEHDQERPREGEDQRWGRGGREERRGGGGGRGGEGRERGGGGGGGGRGGGEGGEGGGGKGGRERGGGGGGGGGGGDEIVTGSPWSRSWSRWRRGERGGVGWGSIAACDGTGDDTAATVAAGLLAHVTRERPHNATSETSNWLTHGGTYLEQRHSPLTQISKNTLSRLAPAWYYEFDTYRGQEGPRPSSTACCTPRARGARPTR